MQAATLVTGASTGIGRELARLAAADGQQLVLVARSEKRLTELASELSSEHDIRAVVVASDLAEPNGVPDLIAAIRAEDLEIDTLINNAGFGHLGAFHTSSRDKQLGMLHLNVMALTELTHAFLPRMVERRTGRILNIASTAAFQPGPFMAVYYASKAYVLSFSEALSEETRGTGVTVTAFCPGPTRTEFQSRAEMEGAPLVRLGLEDARSVAEHGYRAMRRGTPVAISGWMNRLLAASIRVSPRFAVRRIVRYLNHAS